MATRRYGLSRGQTEFQVTEEVGAATVNNELEVTFDLAVGWERAALLQALDMIKNHILSHNYPPA